MPVKEVGALSVFCVSRTSVVLQSEAGGAVDGAIFVEKAEDTKTDDAPLSVRKTGCGKWQQPEHMSILERRALVKSAARVRSTKFGRRTMQLFLVDNFSLCFASEGSRSATYNILTQVRRFYRAVPCTFADTARVKDTVQSEVQ